jgi:hypothetical protein
MWAAGAIVVSCLAFSGLPALAQDETGPSAGPTNSETPAPMVPAVVTGEEYCYGPTRCDSRLSDPRVSGEAVATFHEACYVLGSGCVYWGTYTIQGPDGTWSGPWSGLWEPSVGKAAFLVTAKGTGAYEGWTYMAYYLDPFTGGPATVDGVIYRGDPPPMPWPTSTTSPSQEDG